MRFEGRSCYDRGGDWRGQSSAWVLGGTLCSFGARSFQIHSNFKTGLSLWVMKRCWPSFKNHSQPVTVSLLYDHTQLLSEDSKNCNPPPNSEQREQNLHCQSFNLQDLSYVEIDLLRLHIGIKIHLNWSSNQCPYLFVSYKNNALKYKTMQFNSA